MSSKKKSTTTETTGTGTDTAAAEKKTRKPRTVKPKQPSWHHVFYPETGTYRMIEDFDHASVKERISPKVVITSATPQHIFQAGVDGVKLESRPVEQVNDYTGTAE